MATLESQVANSVSNSAANTAEAEAAVQLAESALASLSARDTASLRGMFHESGRLVSLSDDPATPARVTQLEQFLSGLGEEGPVLLERMWDPTVHVDGRLATVWTPYDFYRDGEFSHCGIDVFQLARVDERWQILSITYTVHRDGCAESPLGRPS